MDPQKNKPTSRFRKHLIIIYAALIAVALLTLLTNVFGDTDRTFAPAIVWLMALLILIIAVIAILTRAFKIQHVLEENNAKLEELAELLKKNHAVMTNINQNTRLGESVKQVVFRDAHTQVLKEIVFDKLQQKDFDATYEIIDEIAHNTTYKELAKQLRDDAERYRHATDAERINQVVAHIEKLLEAHQWAKASVQIEKLIKAQPQSEKPLMLRQKLLDKKQERKRILLTAWDDAVKRQDTERSLEVLRELDLYLIPNEGLALQEAAKDVFMNKLHNLGVQFSLAVSDKEWAKAYRTGRQIINDFPNSKMAQEIRERMDVLTEKIRQSAN
ncbi:MAG TPA: hypothetical protein VMW23_09885 [Sedimentisphaerales bacterium]|nr:hypothetical protein [Sedimentisphaerales bacterium]